MAEKYCHNGASLWCFEILSNMIVFNTKSKHEYFTLDKVVNPEKYELKVMIYYYELRVAQ